jgi:hypothetical protein
VNGLEEAYAPPQSDAEQSAEAAAEADVGETRAPAYWYAIPLWRLFLFSLLGGSVYQFHFTYRAWQAHRESFGYSAEPRWRARYEATGFRVSPFWRAALTVHNYSWLLVVGREARRRGVPGFGPAGLWFLLQLAALVFFPPGWNILALSLALLPAQLTVNRLHDKTTGSRARAPISAAELCWLAMGVYASWTALQSLGTW